METLLQLPVNVNAKDHGRKGRAGNGSEFNKAVCHIDRAGRRARQGDLAVLGGTTLQPVGLGALVYDEAHPAASPGRGEADHGQVHGYAFRRIGLQALALLVDNRRNRVSQPYYTKW